MRQTARVLVVNPADEAIHVTLSLLDANDGSVIKRLTLLVDGRSAALSPDVASYLANRPGYVRIETADGELIFTELLVEPDNETRGMVDTLHIPALADEYVAARVA